MKYVFVLITLPAFLFSCGPSTVKDIDQESIVSDAVYSHVLGSPLSGDAVVAADGSHGSCVISPDFSTVTYIKTDLTYTGQDGCDISASSCTHPFTIDFSIEPPVLAAGAVGCSSI
ncbi:MAG: hypothetical protein V4654_08325 [Bdellovibrionota bacterium]